MRSLAITCSGAPATNFSLDNFPCTERKNPLVYTWQRFSEYENLKKLQALYQNKKAAISLKIAAFFINKHEIFIS